MYPFKSIKIITKNESAEFTMQDGSFVSALKKDPEISLGYKIKHDL